MALINELYFQGPLAIGQLDTLPVSENVGVFIDKYEPEFMLRLMGAEFYTLFKAGLEVGSVDPRMEALRDGGDYSRCEEDWHWIGFANEQLQSPIANYVYSKYQYDQATQSVGIGVVSTTAENAVRAKYWAKDVRAWNEMVTWIGDFYGYIDSNEDVYPEFPFKKAEQYFRRHGKTCGCGCHTASHCAPDCDPVREWCFRNTLDI